MTKTSSGFPSLIAYEKADSLHGSQNVFTEEDAIEVFMTQPTCLLDNVGLSRIYGDGDNQVIGDSNIDDEDDDDFVSFINFGSTNVDISGWELYVDQNGTGSPVFTFPASTVLAPCDEVTVISDWNGGSPLPSNWFDANFASGEGMFEETSHAATFAILRNPSSNEYFSFHHLSSTPTLSTGTMICEYNFTALITNDFDGCEMIFWNALSNSYEDETDCSIYSAYTPCIPPPDEICNNGIDDDGDGDTDCLDDDCYLTTNSGDADNDNDTIGDICDLDDDNDGIPDLEECNGTFVLDGTHTVSTFNSTQLSSTASGVQFDVNLINGITFNTATGPNLGNFTIGPPAPYNGSQNYLYLEINTDQNVADHGTYTITFPTVVVNPTIYFGGFSSSTNSPTWSLTLVNQTPEVEMNLIYTDGEFLISGDTMRASVVTSTNGNGLVEFIGIVQQLQFEIGHYSPTNQEGRVRFTTNVGFTLCDDVDSDGVPNMYDLDSDNDGIFDIDEAGHAAADANDDGIIDGASGLFGANGLFDALETSADSDTINYTIADSESTPDGNYDAYEIDADGDTCFDTTEEGVSDSDVDGIAGTGAPAVNSLNGLVTAITYSDPPNAIWQNPVTGPCLVEICNDGIDNDADGDTDYLDSDCCAAQAPTLSK